MSGEGGDRPAEPSPPPALDPARFRRGATARGYAFGTVATLALLVPPAAGLDWSSWLGVDGGVAAVVALACISFAWPPPLGPASASLGHAALAAASGLAATAAFVTLAQWTAGHGGATAAQLGLAAALLAAATLLGRRGGAPVALIALAAVVGGALLSRGPVVDGSMGESSAAAGGAGPGRSADVARVRLELTGPLTSAAIRADGLVPLLVTADLGPGETLATPAWIAARRDRGEFGARFQVTDLQPEGDPGKRVSVVLDETAGGLHRIDGGLAGRPRPALLPWARRAPPLESIFSAWAVLLVITSIGGRLGTSRPMLGGLFCLVAGGAGAALCAWVAGFSESASRGASEPGVRVLEGAVGADGRTIWLQVDRARGALSIQVDSPGAAGGRVSVADGRPWRTRLDARGERPVATVEAAPGVAVDLIQPLEPGLRGLQPAVNTWGDLQLVWRRTFDGAWSAHGAWGHGEPLADAIQSADPPAWSVLGLPAGLQALVGRIEPGAFDGVAGAGPSRTPIGPGARPSARPSVGGPGVVWIRMTRP